MARRPRYPQRQEDRHAARILAYVDDLAAMVQAEIIAKLPAIYPQPGPPVVDASGAVVIAFDDIATLTAGLGELRLRWGTEVASPDQIRRDCTSSAVEIDAANSAETASALRAAGYRAVTIGAVRESIYAAELPAWVAEHTTLIVRGGTWRGIPVTPLGEQAIEQIGETVRAGFAEGLRHEEVADRIAERMGVIRSRANLIARDQTNKLNGKLTLDRYRRAGLAEYIWRTSRDERVRQEHAELEGERFGINAPPAIGHPGQPIQCRCTAEPVPRQERGDS